ncbi:MAG: zf-HC2 domain-containing protein [Clostridia bacterium]|nr:zf-HC2 domain-containing protein [Clostridia bacterium]
MKTECCLVKDLLPLYAENMVSDETAALVAEHLNECADCAARAERLRQPAAEIPAPEATADEAAPLRRVKKNLKKRKAAVALLAAAAAFLAVFAVFSHLTRPNYVPFENSGAAVHIAANGVMSVSFSEAVTSCRVVPVQIPDAPEAYEIEIEAWSSGWDKILGKKAGTVVLPESPAKEQPQRVYYCDMAKQGDLLCLYGEPRDDGGIVLPRLFLGAYFFAALALAAAAGLLRVLLRRNEKAATALEYILFAPLSYLAAHLVLLQGFVSYSAARDFVMLCAAAAGVYGILAGVRMLRKTEKY